MTIGLKSPQISTSIDTLTDIDLLQPGSFVEFPLEGRQYKQLMELKKEKRGRESTGRAF